MRLVHIGLPAAILLATCMGLGKFALLSECALGVHYAPSTVPHRAATVRLE